MVTRGCRRCRRCKRSFAIPPPPPTLPRASPHPPPGQIPLAHLRRPFQTSSPRLPSHPRAASLNHRPGTRRTPSAPQRLIIANFPPHFVSRLPENGDWVIANRNPALPQPLPTHVPPPLHWRGSVEPSSAARAENVTFSSTRDCVRLHRSDEPAPEADNPQAPDAGENLHVPDVEMTDPTSNHVVIT